MSFSPTPGNVFSEAGLAFDESFPEIDIDVEDLGLPNNDYTPVTAASPLPGMEGAPGILPLSLWVIFMCSSPFLLHVRI